LRLFWLRYRRGGAGPNSRKEAAAEAGLSERQAKTALRVANIPEQEFERQIESEDVPTITELADQGTKHKLEDLDVAPENNPAVLKFIGVVNHVRREGKVIDFNQLMSGIRPSEIAALRSALADAFQVLRDFQNALDAYPGDVQDKPSIVGKMSDGEDILWF
jgi:hypothetical protein